MPPVKVCGRCGGDVALGQRCPRCEPAARRARRHPGYDDPVYRRTRRAKAGKPCEHPGCPQAGAILHHIDGDPSHNTAANYRWLCQAHAAVADAAMRAARRGRQTGKASPWR